MSKPTPITEFVPTGIKPLEDILAGVTDPVIEVQKVEPVPPVVPVPVEPVPPAELQSDEPGDIAKFVPDEAHSFNEPKLQKKNDNSAMRDQLKKVAQEKAQYEADLAKVRAEREVEKAAWEKQHAEFDRLRKEHEALTVKASQTNPMAHPEIQKITKPWNEKVPQLATQLRESGMKAKDLDAFLGRAVGEYMSAGDPESDEFYAKMEQIRDAVEGYTASIRRESDKISAQEKIMGMIRDGAGIGRNVQTALQEMQQNAPVFHYKEQRAIYETEEREYANFEREFFNPSEDVRHGDPLNQKVLLRAMIDGSDEVKKAAQNAVLFSKIVALPLKPLNPSELANMSPEQAEQLQIATVNRHQEAKRRAVKLMPEALVAYAVFPALWKELETLRKQVKGEREVPKPNLRGGQTPVDDEDEGDITKFVPVGIDPKTLPL